MDKKAEFDALMSKAQAKADADVIGAIEQATASVDEIAGEMAPPPPLAKPPRRRNLSACARETALAARREDPRQRRLQARRSLPFRPPAKAAPARFAAAGEAAAPVHFMRGDRAESAETRMHFSE